MADNAFFNFQEYIDKTYGNVVEVVAASTDEEIRHMDGLYDNTIEAIAASTDEEIRHMDGRFASLMNAVIGRRALWYIIFAGALAVLAGFLVYWVLGLEYYGNFGPNMVTEPNKIAITFLPPAVGAFVFTFMFALPFGFVEE